AGRDHRRGDQRRFLAKPRIVDRHGLRAARPCAARNRPEGGGARPRPGRRRHRPAVRSASLFPQTRLRALKHMRFTKDHEWVELSGDTATIGITAYAAEQLGDVVFVELPEPGRAIKAGEPMAVVESVK